LKGEELGWEMSKANKLRVLFLRAKGFLILDPSVLVSGAQLEHELSLISPSSTVAAKPQTPAVGKVPKILLEVTNQNAAETEFLTPQKKLLNSIDIVEKEVMMELQKLKRSNTQC